MTVPSQTNRDQQAGNGVTTAFTVPFRILDQTHIEVLRTRAGVTTTLVLTTNYTVSNVGDPNTTVTFVVAPAVGDTLTFLRNVPLTQETDYVPNDPFPAESHERALDKLTMIAQQHEELIERSMTLPPQVSGVSTELPVPSPNTIFGWNPAGDAVQNFPLSDIATNIAYGDKDYQIFAGTGAQKNFTLSRDPASLGNLDISIDGATQVPGTDYTYAGTTLTFVAAPANGAVILVRYDVAVPVGSALASATQFTQQGAGAVVRTVQARLRDTINAVDFGVVADNFTDNTAALNAAIAEASSRGGASILLPPGIMRHNSALTITSSGVELVGAGAQITHDGGSAPTPGSVLFYVGGGAVDQLTFTSPAGASARKQSSGGLRNLWLDGNGTAARGLVVRSWARGQFCNVYVQNYTTAGIQVDVISGSLAEGKDTQHNSFRHCYAYVSNSTAHGWFLDGDLVANASFNTFIDCGARHRNGDAWHLENSDNNSFVSCGGFRDTGGTGFALQLYGDTVSKGPARSNHFIHFTGNGGVQARTGTVVHAIRNTITFYDTDNNSPDPIIQAGAQLEWSQDTGVRHGTAAVQLALGETTVNAKAARDALTNESVRIHNTNQKHVILSDGTNTWFITIAAAGHLNISGPAGKFVVPFNHHYMGSTASLGWDPSARTASATTGASGALPAQVAGYLTMYKEDGTTVIKVPYYNP